MAKSIAALLPKLEVFNFLEESDYPTIEKYFFKHDYDEGSYVFKEGGHGGYMFFIADGEVEIIKQFDNKKHTIAKLGEGRSVGEMSLIEQLPVSADVVAVSEAKVASVDEKRFQFLIQNHPFFAQEVMKIMAHRLRMSNQR